MIAATPKTRQPDSWQRQLAVAIEDPAELCRILELDPALIEPARRAGAAFKLRVPRSYVARMQRGNPADPLLLQVLPLGDELRSAPGYSADPLLESAATKAPGLLQKYQGRALLITTGACAVHCRYCFRREFPYAEAAATGERWQAALDTLAADTSVRELILSGGDPLSLSNARLAALFERLRRIPHLETLRLHTRLPVVLPARIDAELLRLLAESPWQRVLVLHINHAQEIDAEVRAACAALRASGVMVLNQSVLLRAINDSAPALAELSRTLWSAGVLPYYLHLLDPVRGASHFDVPELEARALAADLHALLPGYLVPRLVREQPGVASKRPIALF